MKKILSGLAVAGLAASGAVATAATANAAGCVSPSQSNVQHTVNRTTGAVKVWVPAGKTLCDPLNIAAATYAYDMPAKPYKNGNWQSYPQTYFAKTTATLTRGSVNLTIPARDCAQHDVYASTGSLSLPGKISSRGESKGDRKGYTNGEPAYLSDWSNGQPSHYFDKVTGCNEPDAPKPVLTPEDRQDCDVVEKRTKTVTTDYVLNNGTGRWEKKESTGYSDWTKVRDTTPAEKKAQDCAKPEQPQPKVTTGTEPRENCDIHEQRTITTTVNAVFDESTWTWKDGEPVTTYSDWTKVRDTTSDEKEAAGCEKPEQPQIIADPLTDSKKDCESVYTRKGATTTEYVWSHEAWDYVKGEPVTTWSDWTPLSDTTPAEKVELGCEHPAQPEPVVEVASSSTPDCFTLTTTESTITTPYVFDESTWEYVAGETVITEETTTRDLTDLERTAMGVECETPQIVIPPTVDKPEPQAPVTPAPEKPEPKKEKVERVQAASPAPEALAFTGMSPGLWIAAGIGFAALLSGALLLFARRSLQH